jgi:hypothetical protein
MGCGERGGAQPRRKSHRLTALFDNVQTKKSCAWFEQKQHTFNGMRTDEL